MSRALAEATLTRMRARAARRQDALALRLLGNVVPDERGCWCYAYGTTVLRRGHLTYGLIWVRDRNQYAHRVAYTLWVGPLRPREPVLRRCGNPCCIAPYHLEKWRPPPRRR